ncbi:MAG: endo-1,4-beta-xylanase [Clostridia bacterium]|nr:endo-1,4-beta-xylanase [Clostridia bacterium]
MGIRDICGKLYFGAAVSPYVLKDERCKAILKEEFSSLTCENDMKPERLLDRDATLKAGEENRARLSFARAEEIISFAAANGQRMRGHTLVWHNQTPRWFFAEGWQDAPDAPLADRDTMLKRMENYIRDVMDYMHRQHPGLIYAWDVLNEFIEPDNGHEHGCRTRKNLWFDIFGEEVPYRAFSFARRYAAPGEKLFYNDYNEYEQPKRDLISRMLRPLIDKGLVDGMGLQSHVGMEHPSFESYEASLKAYADMGLCLEVTELDMRLAAADAASFQKQAERYGALVRLMRACPAVDSVTLWGVTDAFTWLSRPDAPAYPLLFDREGNKKLAYDAVREALKI